MTKLVKSLLAVGLCLALGCGDSDSSTGDPAVDAGRDAGETKQPPFMPSDSGMQNTAEQFMCEQTACTVPELDISSLDLPAIMGLPIDAETIASMGFGPMGCCVDGDICGVTQQMLFGAGFCAEQDQAGEPSAECPNEEADVLGLLTLTLEGCCRSDNKCGLNLDLIGVGCVEREEASMIEIMGMSLPDAETIQSIDCNVEPTDAGTEDAGSL